MEGLTCFRLSVPFGVFPGACFGGRLSVPFGVCPGAGFRGGHFPSISLASAPLKMRSAIIEKCSQRYPDEVCT